MSGPDVLMFIRHGEKPPHQQASKPPHGVDHLGRHSAHSLLPRGWQRAGALATLFTGSSPALAQPDAVFAPDYGSNTLQHRTSQTVTPLARRLGLEVRTPVRRGDEPALVADYLTHLPGAVLVCWEHHHLPKLARAFADQVGMAADELPEVARRWPDEDYWTVLAFVRGDEGDYQVVTTSQAALEGDPPRS